MCYEIRQQLTHSTMRLKSAVIRVAGETRIEDAIGKLENNQGKMLVTRLTASDNGKTVNGQIHLALASGHRNPMVMDHTVRR